MAQTAIDWYDQELRKCMMGTVPCDPIQIREQANQMFKEQIINAIMYALDEDGHTGDWKIKFANEYYDKMSQ
jgi:hypothetical protein